MTLASALFWTKVGAIGSCVSSAVGAAAFVIAIIALVLPQKRRMRISVSRRNVFAPNELITIEPNVCAITIRNVGSCLVNIEQIFISVGKKGQQISAGILSDGTVSDKENCPFPFKIDPGCKEIYYAPLDDMLNVIDRKMDNKKKIYIFIIETTCGEKIIKTRYKFADFISC